MAWLRYDWRCVGVFSVFKYAGNTSTQVFEIIPRYVEDINLGCEGSKKLFVRNEEKLFCRNAQFVVNTWRWTLAHRDSRTFAIEMILRLTEITFSGRRMER